MADKRYSRRNVSELEHTSSQTKKKNVTGVSQDLNSLTLEDSKQKGKKGSNFTYTATKIIGRGTFGEVYQATIAETGEIVAIKKVFQDKRYKNRELQIMRQLNHSCVIELKNAFYTLGERQDDQYLNLVMDFMAETVFDIMRQYAKMRQSMPMLLVKLYTYQLIRSLAYIHQVGICHRDIKPQNLLVDPSRHILKLCDFGSAKQLVKGEPNVSYICSRFYRAPELIFGAIDYTCSIDVWSAGCVLGEMLNNTPLFPGESGVDQLVEIIKVLGTPTKEQIQDMNPNYTEFRFPKIKPHPWNKMFRSKTPPEAIDLISKLLVYPPQQRLKPMEALLHPFFDELRDQNCKLPNGNPLPELFNFSPEEVAQTTPEIIDQLVPSWYKELKAQQEEKNAN